MELTETASEWYVNDTLDDRSPDIIVCVGTCRFHLHKDVLMKSCDYFKAMFSSHMLEYAQDIITVKLIDKCPFEILIKGFYSGQLCLTLENIFEVTLAAHILQVSSPLFKECCGFMTSLIDLKMCFEILSFSQFHNLQEVYDASKRYSIIHFSALCKEESFLSLTLDQVVNYLSDEFLVTEEEFGKARAFISWIAFNGTPEPGILQKALCKILHCTNSSPHLCNDVAQKLIHQENIDDYFLSPCLNTLRNQDLMMFWARLSDSTGEGLVDVVKLSDLSGNDHDVRGLKVDTMTNIVEKPGFDLGSAVCRKGLYIYVCGGGPNFGRMDWIREIWRYSVLEDSHRWSVIGKAPHPLRYHAMVPVDNKLYIFGGFGKFRSKNCKLQSFDILTGAWSEHARVPTWEIKPVVTYFHKTIFYICREWNIYAYDSVSNVWTSLDPSSPIHDVPFNASDPHYPNNISHTKLLSCFVLPPKPNSSYIKFIVFSQGNQLQTHSFAIYLNSKSVCRLEPDCKHSVDLKTHSYSGSCLLGNRIVVFFKTVSGKEMDGGDMDMDHPDNCKDSECTPFRVLHFSFETGQFSEWFQLNNVVKMQSILAVPFVPKTFNISS